MIFETRVSGIPCQCRVERCPTDEEAEFVFTQFEFRLLDRKGYLAPWLERKLDEDKSLELFDEFRSIVDAHTD